MKVDGWMEEGFSPPHHTHQHTDAQSQPPTTDTHHQGIITHTHEQEKEKEKDLLWVGGGLGTIEKGTLVENVWGKLCVVRGGGLSCCCWGSSIGTTILFSNTRPPSHRDLRRPWCRVSV